MPLLLQKQLQGAERDKSKETLSDDAQVSETIPCNCSLQSGGTTEEEC